MGDVRAAQEACVWAAVALVVPVAATDEDVRLHQVLAREAVAAVTRPPPSMLPFLTLLSGMAEAEPWTAAWRDMRFGLQEALSALARRKLGLAIEELRS